MKTIKVKMRDIKTGQEIGCALDEALQKEFLDMKRPTLKEGEAICSTCWKVVQKNQRVGWRYYSFKHLEAVEICVECQPEWGPHHEAIQSYGL